MILTVNSWGLLCIKLLIWARWHVLVLLIYIWHSDLCSDLWNKAFRKNLSFFPQSFPNQSSSQIEIFFSEPEPCKRTFETFSIEWPCLRLLSADSKLHLVSLLFTVILNGVTLFIRGTIGTTWQVQFPGLSKRVRVAGPMGKVAWV